MVFGAELLLGAFHLPPFLLLKNKTFTFFFLILKVSPKNRKASHVFPCQKAPFVEACLMAGGITVNVFQSLAIFGVSDLADLRCFFSSALEGSLRRMALLAS